MNRKNGLVSVKDAGMLSHVATFPRYDRDKLRCGIAHMSEGYFHRAHQALFMHEYLQTHPEPWMTHGIKLLGDDIGIVKRMNAQNNLYTLTERSGSHDVLKIIGSIKEVWHAQTDPQRVINLLAADHIKIISLTVTEKGYSYTPDHHLDVEDKIIVADLVPKAVPTSAIGYLFSAAKQRMEHRGSPLTIMSCDNLPGNGDLTRSLLLEFADLKEPAVRRWIEEHISFPNSMVDRITPATTEETVAFVRNRFGIDDKCPVISEAYLQWILEDRFINGRPHLEKILVPVQLETKSISAQIQLTDSVKPYEMLKMRLLNGSHSALAYVAYLMGHRSVDEAMRDSLLSTFVRQYMEEVSPTLPELPSINIPDYKDTLIQRFSNPATGDQISRLAQDGSAKLRNFLIPPLKQQLEMGGPIRHMALVLAAWFRYLRGIDEEGSPIIIEDPLRDVLVKHATMFQDDPERLLSVDVIFEKGLSANRRLVAEVKQAVDNINNWGTREALRRSLE